MKILSQIGSVLFIVLLVLSFVLNIFKPKWYWQRFIPMLHKKEEKHPVITIIVILLLAALMLYGVISSILIR
jgi:L-lactate permease